MKTKIFLLAGMLLLAAANVSAQWRISTEGDSELFALKEIGNSSDYGKRYPAASVFVSVERGNQEISIRIVDGSDDGRAFVPRSFAFGDLRDGNSSDATFANVQAVVDWFDDNAGKSKASGGNGGSAAPTTVLLTTSRDLAAGDVNAELLADSSVTLTVPLSFSAMSTGDVTVLLVDGAVLTVEASAGVALNGDDGGTEVVGNGSGQASAVLKKTGANTYLLFQ